MKINFWCSSIRKAREKANILSLMGCINTGDMHLKRPRAGRTQWTKQLHKPVPCLLKNRKDIPKIGLLETATITEYLEKSWQKKIC